ncbi:COP9 signalosome complex subunit 7a isoform X2 [Passer domesticus]|uniref:COP9 signalosome complex subunit 7a isoform X2 n=1 Tax=Passer domesticus TaxID=48849 RepID=UPI0030FED80E
MERGVSKGPVAPARSGECHPRTGPSLGAEAPRDPPPPGRPPGLIPAAPRLSAPRQCPRGDASPPSRPPAPVPASIIPGPPGPVAAAGPGGGRRTDGRTGGPGGAGGAARSSLTGRAPGTHGGAEAANLPPLTEAQKNKLRHLSVVTLAAKIKCIPYSVLLEQLQLKNVRQLEDLVIEAVYADVLRGSLDQRNQRLEVDYSIGRDIRREELSTITRTLQEWCQGCEVVLSGIEEQVSRANQHKEQQLALKQQIESEVANLKKTIKVTTAAAAAATSQDPEQHLTELREPAPGTNQRQASKKTSKAKGLRGSTKIWSKSN